MPDSAWDGVYVIEEALKESRAREHRKGLTMVIDTCLGSGALADVLETAGTYIDHWKCSYGTSALIPAEVLRRKLDLLRAREIVSFPGGTLLEAAVVHQHCRVFTERARAIGFDAVEISDGTITLPPARRRNMIRCALDHDLIPITEVGKKDPERQPPAAMLAEQALDDLESGAHYVVVDARESGTAVGIFDVDGALREAALEEIVTLVGGSLDRIIWEAPQKHQQAELIRRLGPEVNLGNVRPQDVLALEALRTGLRFETLREIAQKRVQSGQWEPEAVEVNGQ